MSISNNKMPVVVFMFALFFALQVEAVSIRVTEGVPLMDPSSLIEEGIKKGNADLLREAWRHYEQALRLTTGSSAGYLELGEIYFHLSLLGESTDDDFKTAEFFARQAVAENPDDSDAHRALGLILAGRGAFLDALEELTVAWHLNPTNNFIIYDLAALHLALRQPQQTVAYLESQNHKSGWPYVVLAMAWMQQDAPGKALINLYRAKHLGYSNYWVNKMLQDLGKELNMPLK